MLFSTPFFVFVFLPIFFGLYWFLPLRRPILLLGSAIFYAWSEPIFIFVVFASALFDWLLGRGIASPSASPGRRKFCVALGVISNLGMLAYVKYAAFAVTNVNTVLGHFAVSPFTVPQIALPLGVSFIVFEKITYVVDLYRGVAGPARSFLDYLNYVFLFPKLLAGPIVKYHDIATQLAKPSHRYEDVRDGLIRFIQGLGKKVMIADTLAPPVDRIFNLPFAQLDIASAWLGLISFALQIYFDFSGYSDMAIGLGRILGFRLLENFNQPYLATSFTDFWRRWHISLSSWIKEYLYIPLGGSRVPAWRSYLNLCICFVLSGLWHGASWNFVIWGCAHGIALVLDRAFWLKAQKSLPRALNRLLTVPFILLTWVFFRCPTFPGAMDYFRALFGGSSAAIVDAPLPGFDVVFMLAIGFGVILTPLVTGSLDTRPGPASAGRRVAILTACSVLLLLSIGRMAVSSFHPFLYFRF